MLKNKLAEEILRETPPSVREAVAEFALARVKMFNPKKYKCWLTGYGMGEPNRAPKKVKK